MIQADLIEAPAENAAGWRSVTDQLERGVMRRKGWTMEVDGHEDAVFLRKVGAGPAVSYFNPEEPDILGRLDLKTGELIGVDLLRFRKGLAKRYPQLRRFVVIVAVNDLRERAPSRIVRRLATWVLDGMQRDLTEQIEAGSGVQPAPA